MVAEITDKRLLRRRLARAHRGGEPGARFLIDHVTADIIERLSTIERRFEIAVAHGGQTAALADALRATGKANRVVRFEQTDAAFSDARVSGVVGDEETLPFGPASIDLFVSALALQWTNDLPGALIQIRNALKPDGLLLAAMTGGGTLAELREALAAAESEIRGGVSPRVIPAADVRDLGALLQRAGFALPVVDRDALTVRYDFSFRPLPRSPSHGRRERVAGARPAADAQGPLSACGRNLRGAFQRSGRSHPRDVRDRLAFWLVTA